jgi:hypothetical protein
MTTAPAPVPSIPHQDLHRRLAQRLPLIQILELDWLQPRVDLDSATIAEYAALYVEGGPDAMEPVTCWTQGEARHPVGLSDSAPAPATLILTRGFTRLAAARQAGLSEISALVYTSPADATAAARMWLLDSLGGNKHGQRLTTQDKRRALILYHQAIDVEAWASTRAVAHLIGCSHDMVAAFRRDLVEQVQRQEPEDSGEDQGVSESDSAALRFGASTLTEVQGLVAELLPALLTEIARRPDLTPIPEIKARILLAVYLTTRIPDPDFEDDGSPISRSEIQAIIGYPPDVHPAQLAKRGWISGNHADGYAITAQGHALCWQLDEQAAGTDDLPPAPPAPPANPRRNLAGELHLLVAAQDGEPLGASNAAEELDTDTATILALASTHPGLRVTEREVGDSRVPAVELVPSDPEDLVQPQSHWDDDEAPGPRDAAAQARADRRHWMIDQARPTIAQRGAISTRAAQLVALHLGLDYDDAEPYRPAPGADRHLVDAQYCAAALAMLQRIAATSPSAWYDCRLVDLLPAIAPDLGLDWSAIETAASARFSGGFRGDTTEGDQP